MSTKEDKALSVLFFSHSRALTGAERSLFELVSGLINHGTDCTVVCPGDGPLVDSLRRIGASALVAPGLDVWWIGESRHAVQTAVAAGAGTLLRMMPILERIEPDVVFTQTITIPWGASAAALLDKPHVWSICELGDPDHGISFPDGRADVIEQVESGASFIITACEAIRTTLFPNLESGRVRTIYRDIDVSSASAPAAGAFRRTGATRLAAFGTLSEGKGQLDAVKATAELVARGRDVELLLAGIEIPEYRSKIDALIDQFGLDERVNVFGFIAEPHSTMLATDIIVHCARNDGFGRAVAEGMKLGRPVVYPRSGGIPEYMKDGITGLSYSPGNVNELVERIEELMDDPERALQIGAKSRQHAEAKFTGNSLRVYRILKDLQNAESTSRRVAIPKQVVASLAAALAQADQSVSDAENKQALLQDNLLTMRDSNKALHNKLKTIRTKLDALRNSRSFVLIRTFSWPLRWLRSLNMRQS